MATISNIDESRLETSSVGYAPAQTMGTHCAGADNNYHAIASNGYSESGSLRTFDKQSDGSFVENTSGTGSYAMTKSDNNPSGFEYTELSKGAENRTYSETKATSFGMNVSTVSSDGQTATAVVDSSSIRNYGNGMYSANIGGQNYY